MSERNKVTVVPAHKANQFVKALSVKEGFDPGKAIRDLTDHAPIEVEQPDLYYFKKSKC